MTGPGHLRWRWRVPRPQAWDPGPQASTGAPPQTPSPLRVLALGHTRQDLALEVRRGGRLEQAE